MRGKKGEYGLRQLMDYVDITDATMVEIGCFTGESTHIFCACDRIKTVYAVDPWKGNYDEEDLASSKDMIAVEQYFDDRLQGNKKCIKTKTTSVDAAKEFEDKSLDMVYIDGCHKYESVVEDINAWKPKIKEGGYISGHDFERFRSSSVPVKQAVLDTLGEPNKVFLDGSWVFKL